MDEDEIAGFIRCAYCGTNKLPFPLGPLEKSEHPLSGEMDYYYTCTGCNETCRVRFDMNRLVVQKSA